jgi:hypothetical protein
MSRARLGFLVILLALFSPAAYGWTQDVPLPCFWYDDDACFEYSGGGGPTVVPAPIRTAVPTAA